MGIQDPRICRMGQDPRPAPPARTRTAVDYCRWRENLVCWECCQRADQLEEARGTCDLVTPKRVKGHRHPSYGSRGRDLSDPLERGKAILAAAKVATYPTLDRMDAAQIRTALGDLEARIRARQDMGVGDSKDDDGKQGSV